jgi:hypothetical protein
MSEAPKINWQGKSGKNYVYWIYPIGHRFGKADGNYIFAKVDSKNQWLPIYFGEGDLETRPTDQHHQWDCVKGKEATHIHAHTNAKEQDRLDEENDLLANYSQAYAPNGCNIKEGG